MDHISSLLPKVLKKRGLDKHANASLIIMKSQEWICENLKEYENDLHPKKFQDGVLFISCINSVAAQECHQISTTLLEFLRDVCPDIPLEQIRLIRSDAKA